MTTSMITTATMMTDVVVAPSLRGILVGCMLLLTRTVPVIVVVPTVWGGEVVPTVWGGEVVPTVWGGEVVPTVWGGEVVPTVWGGEVVPTVWRGEVIPTVWEGSSFDAVERKHTSCMSCNKRHQGDRNINGDKYLFRFMLP